MDHAPRHRPTGRTGAWSAFRQAHLHDYGPAATRFWLALAAAGLVAVLLALARLAGAAATERWQIAGWLVVVGIAARFPIQVPRSKHHIVTGDIVNFLLLAQYGAPAAVLGAALEGLIGALSSSKRLTSHVATCAANAAAMAIAGALFGAVQQALLGGLPPAAAHLGALAVAAGAHFVFSTMALMHVISIKLGRRLTLAEWWGGSAWVGALYLVSAVLAGMLSLNAQQFGRSAVAVGVLIIGLSLALLRAHFRQQIAGHAEQEARVAAAEAESAQNQQRFHSAFSQASIGMAIVAGDGRVLQANQALADLLGAGDASFVLGRPFRALLHPGDAPLLDRQLAALVERHQEHFSIELRCIGAEQRETWVSLHCALFDDGTIVQLHDISSRRRAEGELRHVAFHDPLTDLANRACFNERLSVAVETSRKDRRAGFAVMVLDLDRFKIVNDSLGHPAGDELLKQVGHRLAASVRPQDLVARLGGDEFAILLEGTHEHGDAVALGERLLDALARPVRINGTDLRPQASVGLTFSDMGYREPDEVLRDADLAMYQAKAAGKGRLALFDATLHAELGHRLQLESDLRQAIGDGQLALAYQPLYALEPHRLVGFEALARWVHPERGMISPGVFIALAEETGCIEALTRWAIDEAVRQHAAWQRERGLDLVMHVNVSGKDLAQPGFVQHVSETLARHGLAPELLVLEITESTLMAHREQALQTLDALGALGVKLGIDDFGTGYSSLAYLSTLPFDCLKIDRSFVMGMDRSPQNLEIVRTVISLGRSLHKQVVAEGIETREQLKMLRALGATIGQGYLLARPLQPAQVAELLDEPQLAPA